MALNEVENKGRSPIISVIVPAYNAECCLIRCVESVLRQTLGDFEVVIVDDGSTDGTAELCDKLVASHPSVRTVHQGNMGLSGARNTGIENARGSLLFFLDSDDYIAPDELEILYNTMRETGASMVVGGVSNIDENGELISTVRIALGVVDERGFWEGYGRGTRTDEHCEYVVSWGKLFDASLFQGERFDVGKIHEDEFIIHRLVARAGKVAFADTVGYHYVQTSGSIMHTPSPAARLDAAEGLIARSAYFESLGWWDFAFTALCEARGALSNGVEADPKILADERFIKLKAQWVSVCRKVSGKSSVSVKQRVLCSVFELSPVVYKALKGKR